MKKHTRVEIMLQTLPSGASGACATLDPCYLGWFACFNAGDYYEAHDVLEHLWLRTQDENHAFFKGLIQLAGAFVHLRKHHERPLHAKDGMRLRPAARLFGLASRNLAPYGPVHLRLDVVSVCELCEEYTRGILASGYSCNPWRPSEPPRIELGR